MNTQKSVFKKISKIEHPQQVELSEVQKIELALIDDIDSSLKKSFDLIESQSQIIAIENKIKKGRAEAETALKLAQDGLQKAEELGFSDFIKLMQDKIQQSKEQISLANSMISGLSKLI